MKKYYILYYIISFIFLYISFTILYFNNYIFFNDYHIYVQIMNIKISYYISNYRKCKSLQSPLYCGHKVEGYKVQKKGLHPNNVIVNISIYKHIKIKRKIKCISNDIVVGVVSAPHQFMERLALRIGYVSYNKLSLLFFTGLSDDKKINIMIDKENEIYHDIILFDFVSHYFNSSLMLILEINWIYMHCSKYKYFIYHTPDVFFNYHLFYKTFMIHQFTYPLIAQMLEKNRVLRSNRSRFYVPYSVYNKTHYPPQPNGPLIAFSEETIKILLKNIHRVKLSFWMDDVYLAFLLNEINIKAHSIRNVISLYPIQIKKLPNLSSIVSNILYIHSLPPGAVSYLILCSNKYNKST